MLLLWFPEACRILQVRLASPCFESSVVFLLDCLTNKALWLTPTYRERTYILEFKNSRLLLHQTEAFLVASSVVSLDSEDLILSL